MVNGNGCFAGCQMITAGEWLGLFATRTTVPLAQISGYGIVIAYNAIAGGVMVLMRYTTAIERDELAYVCLEEVRLWPGCESVVSVGVLGVSPDRFNLRIVDYGKAPPKLADRALRAIEREKLRSYHLKPAERA